ncbi:hypothetical protein H5410_017387 [Solanum commersonii]|uniref:Uncharacterized protein n=1 Tax=Solanum commersonii TaxID=4109 RepID=A0A9J5ZZT5_SOLCO|nr:hypothetical protein H5410_017387 [Solanum commersonii]
MLSVDAKIYTLTYTEKTTATTMIDHPQSPAKSSTNFLATKTQKTATGATIRKIVIKTDLTSESILQQLSSHRIRRDFSYFASTTKPLPTLEPEIFTTKYFLHLRVHGTLNPTNCRNLPTITATAILRAKVFKAKFSRQKLKQSTKFRKNGGNSSYSTISNRIISLRLLCQNRRVEEKGQITYITALPGLISPYKGGLIGYTTAGI